MRSTLALLLLFGAVIGVYAVPDPVDTCTLYKVPTDKPCKIEIKWKVHNDVQATATCLEYFPTTFVTGSIVFTNKGENTGKIKCIVRAAYQCVPKPAGDNSDIFLMYDKCYYFPKKGPSGYVEGTVPEYEALKNPAKPEEGRKLCNGGKLSVFYSYTQAKFLGMKAKELGLEKLWIGITKDGNTIEEPKTKIHSELWKVVEGSYWDEVAGKLVVKTNPKPNVVPDEAKYYFMRTRNDEFNQRYQGSFERATKNVKATFACEFEAKFTADQQWYCDKMGSQGLGLDTVYDKPGKLNRENARCLYVTANKYTWDGTYADMNNIKGCKEKPSDLHSVKMDDGTASPEKYIFPSHKGKLRIAGHLVEKQKEDPYIVEETSSTYIDRANALFIQNKCSGSADANKRQFLLQKWRYFNHHGKTQAASSSRIGWDSAYPLNECSDFPGLSSTVGLKNGKLIDMPPEVRAPVVCSLAFFQECENKGNPCGKNVECINEKEFKPNANPNLQGFFTCRCAGPSTKEQDELNKHTKYRMDGSWEKQDPLPKTEMGDWKKQPYITTTGGNGEITCKWNPELEIHCAFLRFFDGKDTYSALLRKDDTDWNNKKWRTGADFSESYRFHGQYHNDKLDQVVVRDGCTVTVRAARYWTIWSSSGYTPNFELLTDAGFGTHEVPNIHRNTLDGQFHLLAPSNVQCTC